MGNILVTYDVDREQREMFEKTFFPHKPSFLIDGRDHQERISMLSNAEVLVSWNPAKELEKDDHTLLRNVRFVQLISAGYDHLRFEMFTDGCKVAANQGAYALPMAEHALAMMLDAAKKLRRYHNLLASGHFEQRKGYTKRVTGSTLGVIGFGAIGKETARLMRPFSVKVLSLNTTGKTTEKVDFCGTLRDLDRVLTESDFLLVSIPLTPETAGLIGKAELEKMKNDAVLVNVARGPILREKDLYEHLLSHPDFFACIDAWWIEPFKFGKFAVSYPFFSLPNLLGSPHNSALVDGIMLEGASRAAENVMRFLQGKRVNGMVPRPQGAAV